MHLSCAVNSFDVDVSSIVLIQHIFYIENYKNSLGYADNDCAKNIY